MRSGCHGEGCHRAAGILDVSLGPLNPAAPINRSRSGQRWMEAALHGTAMVLQRLEPYDVAEDGVTCLKAATEEEWTEQVLRLVGDAGLRRRIGRAAREQVLAEHTIEKRAPAWRAFVAEAAGMGAENPYQSRSQ